MEGLDLREILKNVPKGTILYSAIHGNLCFDCVDYNENLYPVKCERSGYTYSFTKEGKYLHNFDGECMLFPSEEQRAWKNNFNWSWN